MRHPLLRPAALPGWSVVALTVAMTVVTIVLTAGPSRSENLPESVGRYAYLLLGTPFALTGALVTALRRSRVIGVLMMVTGVAISADEFVTAVFRTRREADHPNAWVMWWLGNWLWSVPVVVLLVWVLFFPTGRLPSRRWRPVAGVIIGWGAGLVLLAALGAGHYTGRPRFPDAALPGDSGAFLHTFLHYWYLAFPLLAPLAAGTVVVRYRRAADVERAQLKWLAAAVVVDASVWLVPSAQELGSWPRAVANLSLWLLPAAVAVAVLRYRLYDIDRIINRALVYGSLSLAVGAAYALVMTVFAAVVGSRSSLLAATAASVAVATVFAPLRDRLQRAVDHLLYGDRRDPRRVLSELGERLESALPPEQVLPSIVDTVARTLRLPYVAIELRRDDSHEPVCVRGTPAGEPLGFTLTYQGDVLGRLVVGPRAPGEPFTAAERDLMRSLARHAGVAVHAVRLTGDLQRSRERLVAGREEERFRLRRDLHDGLGPALAGIGFRIAATGRLLTTRPERAAELLTEVRADLKDAVGEVRRLVEGLRPPELDVGLAAAVQALAERLNATEGLTFTVQVAEPLPLPPLSLSAPSLPALSLPPLPAAVEVAAYRIAAEAIANVLRHAGARTCTVSLSVSDGGLRMLIEDDGRGLGDCPPGFGRRSMAERAAELGGECRVEARTPDPGTRVAVFLPMPEGGTPR